MKNTITQAEVKENEQKNGVEIRFPGPLDEIWSEVLRNKLWRFTTTHDDPRWFIRRTPETLAFANRVVAKYNLTLTPKIETEGGSVITARTPVCSTTKTTPSRVLTSSTILRPRFS